MLILAFMFCMTTGVCCAEFVVIANPSVPVNSISRDYLANLFLISGFRWPDGTEAVPFDIAGDSPLKVEFYLVMIDRSMPQVRSYRARLIFTGTGIPPAELDSYAEVLRRVSGTSGAIGYVPRDLAGKSVRVITVSP